MEFLDCRLSYGYSVNDKPFQPCNTMAELIVDMKRANLSGGVVYNIATDVGGVVAGNEILAQDIAAHRGSGVSLWGMYTIVPSFTREIPAASDLPGIMREQGMAVLRMNPAENHFLAVPHVLADYLRMAEKRRIPVLFDTSKGITLQSVDEIMHAFPNLTAILFYENVWPCERYLRPFLALYKNLVLDATHLIQDGAYEEIFHQFGPGRMVHGSGYPVGIMGTGMLTIRHSGLPEAEKSAMAGNTLRRLIEEADYR